MNYIEIIMKLLANRESVSCSEDSILSDFSDNEDPAKAFNEWCKDHSIIVTRNPNEKNIVLSKDLNPQ
jgi:hypothetical protein